MPLSIAIPVLAIDPHSAEPLHTQISRRIAHAIRDGELSGTARLPSSRALARILGVARNTVLAAYDELTDAGLIEGRRGSGMTVAAPTGLRPLSLRAAIRAARYPERIVPLADPDGNPLYLTF